MNKTISITLNGIVFNIEENAYERLKSYLDNLKRHFGSAEYGKEIVDDIESRIGEQFSAKVKEGKKEAINLAEVEEVIKVMGSIEDMGGEPKRAESASPASRRLYRNPDDQVLAGVASGVASYFGIDPVIPRLIFAISILAGGTGVLVYLILWVVIPEAKTGAEKLEMRGDAVTVANLEESHKESADRQKNFSVIRYFFRELFYLMGRFFRALGPFIMTVIGLILTPLAFVCVFAFTLVMLLLLFNPDSAYIDPAIAQVFNGSRYVMLVISGYIALIIPVLTALFLGIGFVRKRSVFTTGLVTLFSVLWLLSALTFGFMASDSAPQIQAAVKSIEERPNQSREFSVTGFDSIESGRDHRVKVVRGDVTRVVAYGQEGRLERVHMEVVDNALVISQADDDFRICLFCINRPVTVEITMPTLTAVDANNVSRVEIAGFSNIAALKLEAHGASRIGFDGSAKALTLDLGSAAVVDLKGSADAMNAELTNASHLNAEEFEVKVAEVEAHNSSRAELNVTESLKAEASGASRINFIGDPPVTELDESNAARINAR